MNRKTKIKDLNSLRAAQAEMEAEIVKREINLKLKTIEIRESLFDFSLISESSEGGIKGFIERNIAPIANSASNFLIKKIIKPKSKWVRKLSTLATSLLIKKYSGSLQSIFHNLLNDPKKIENEPRI
jgi:hypothetical protein